MGRPRKLSDEQIQQIRTDWELFPEWTIDYLARINNINPRTIQRIVQGIPRRSKEPRPMSLDTLNHAGVQFDEYGNAYGLKKPFYYVPLESLPKEPEPEKHTMVKCPHCPQRMTARKLLHHCIDKHQRYDLQYLLEGGR